MTEQIAFEAWIGLLVLQGLLVAAAPVALRIFAEKFVGHAFDQRLESHKARLAAMNDTVRFEFQRQMADVAHFSAKRHQVCAELYYAIRVAHGKVAGLFGLSRGFTFEEFNEDDFNVVFAERKVAQGKREEILTALRADRGRGIEALKTYLRVLDINDARRSYEEANNLLLVNEIYLSDELVDAVKKVIRLLHGILFDAEHPPVRGAPFDRAEREDPHPSILEVRTIMRRELGRGYSGEVSVEASVVPSATL